jgi:hypothetical protein
VRLGSESLTPTPTGFAFVARGLVSLTDGNRTR